MLDTTQNDLTQFHAWLEEGNIHELLLALEGFTNLSFLGYKFSFKQMASLYIVMAELEKKSEDTFFISRSGANGEITEKFIFYYSQKIKFKSNKKDEQLLLENIQEVYENSLSNVEYKNINKDSFKNIAKSFIHSL